MNWLLCTDGSVAAQMNDLHMQSHEDILNKQTNKQMKQTKSFKSQAPNGALK